MAASFKLKRSPRAQRLARDQYVPYADPASDLQDVMTCIREGVTLRKPDG
jgi:hypothetical protein